MAAEQFPAAGQTSDRLEGSATLADYHGAPVIAALAGTIEKPSLTLRASQIMAAGETADGRPTCQQCITMAFFFDGTGNNLEADLGTGEHSNVARMFLAHPENDKAQGLYAVYIPGIGTYFKEIGDPGGTTRGLAFGDEGDKRLEWAFEQFDEKLKFHIKQAENPKNKITMIRVAAFGFSRGATLARAFAVQFQERCQQRGADWQLRAGGHPVRFYFLGLWDTVASVGFPMSTNNTLASQSAGLTSTASAMRGRNLSAIGASVLAFGQPGADPAPGSANGHMGWADKIEIAPMVEKCVHMVAAHEIRNSFPLDSCRRGRSYPDNVEEMVYPGVHSDLGGGYRPGENARSDKPGQMLSLIPLRAMHQRAWEAGVPVYLLTALPTTVAKFSFAVDEPSQPEFTKLHALWQHYMSQAGMGGRGIGQMFNAHIRLYHAWRFHKIRINESARASKNDTADAATLKKREAEWQKERTKLEAEMKPAKIKMDDALRRWQTAKGRLASAQANEVTYGQPVDPALVTIESVTKAATEQPTDDYLKLQARYNSLPGTEGQFAANQNVYDDQLMADAKAIYAQHLSRPSLPLRPHYRALIDAYVAEFISGNGLKDEKIIEFFDNYVHDSLAGFARDATLPSDPRVIYIGGDMKSDHSMNSLPMESGQPVLA